MNTDGGTQARTVVGLTDAAALDPMRAGAKATALASAARAGLPVLPGFVITTGSGGGVPLDDALAEWRSLVASSPVVVRSSSPVEDGASASMAGMFTSVLDVRDERGFVSAVQEVLESARVGALEVPMAVLVQPFVSGRWGGVLFTADPITGRTDRMVVAADRGGADAVVSGVADAWTAAVTRRGRVVERRSASPDAPPASILRALASLGRRVELAFGGPQDVEWLVDPDGQIRLLQSRPITTLHGAVTGPVLGSGPVAETFPDPLSPLEQDLWLEPLRDGLREAISLTGTASRRALRESPTVVAVRGWAAVDLDLLGVRATRRGFLDRLDPRPPARRLRASWRVGRLGAALPDIARDVVRTVDGQLAAVPRLDELANRDLLALLDNSRPVLTALHGYEVLAGLLAPEGATSATGAGVALRALQEAGEEGVAFEDLVEQAPVVLALVPPRIGGAPQLPDVGPLSDPGEPGHPIALAREALRLRARWVQELTARAAWELGRRLEAVGLLAAQEDIRLLSLGELKTVLATRAVPDDLMSRAHDAGSPLPASFRLAEDGTPMPISAAPTAGAVGAGGGIGVGPVHLGADPPEGAVLVVPHLDPRLASVLPRLGGLVAETGSPLSHLAILAREQGVPTVVGLEGAAITLTEGEVVRVDGTSGQVTVAPDVSGTTAPALIRTGTAA